MTQQLKSTIPFRETLLRGVIAAAIVALPSTARAEDLAGRTFNRSIGTDFSFSNIYGDFAGLTFNALTQTYFISENKLDKILEINASGALQRTIDISGLRAAGESEADIEGMTWMYGTTYALVSEGAEEMLIVQINAATTALTRANATVYDLSGDPKGIAYRASEDALYWISEDSPKRVVKSRINPQTQQLEQLANINVDALPLANLSDITFFPRLSTYTLLISAGSRSVVEVDFSGGIPTIRSTFSLASWPIPEGSGVAFGASGNMMIVCKQVGGQPEDDFNVFVPTATIINRSPVARIVRAS